MTFTIEIILNGPEVRAIRILDSANNVIRQERDNSSLIIEPCNGCSGMRSYCCELTSHRVGNLLSYQAEVLFEALLIGLAGQENWEKG